MAVVRKFILHCDQCDINRACMRFPKQSCRCRANRWFTLRTKFTFPKNHLRMVRRASQHLKTLPLTVFAQRNFIADFLRVKCCFIWKEVTALFSPPLAD